MSVKPPKYAERLLLWFLRSDLAEEVQGDLEEKFHLSLKRRTHFRAKVNYWYQVLNYMRPFAIRKSKGVYLNHYDMFQNYFKIGIRNLLKSKFFSFINVTGMAISMAIVFVIAFYIHDELRFDKHLKDGHLKFRVYNEFFDDDGSVRKGSMVPPMIASTMEAEIPQVDYYARFLNFNTAPLFVVGDKKFTEPRGGAADPGIFRMFELTLLEGNADRALTEPNTLAISETLKKKYFGDRSALGESIEVFDENFKIVAVFEDFSSHSHFQRDYFFPMAGIVSDDLLKRWSWNQFHTYVQLKPDSRVSDVNASLKNLVERHAWPLTKSDGGYYVSHLMPLTDIHLHAYDQLWDIAVRGNAQTIYILTGVAAFILIIAILNFVNLSTARAINRVKEVGVRKVVGAVRRQLVSQFVSESIIIALIALVIASVMTGLGLPYVNALSEKSIDATTLLNPGMVAMLVVFGVLVGILAGLYPAVYVSASEPSSLLGNRSTSRSGRSLLRQGLVVFQFILSFFLIMASFVVSEQHAFMRETDMGFEKENVVVLPLRGDMGKNLETTKQAFLDHPNIESASFGYGLPGEAFAGDGIIDRKTGKRWHINMLTVDHDYIQTLGLELVAGRDFSKDILSDEQHAFILSESAAKMIGYTEPSAALQHELAWDRWDAPDSLKVGKVIGIVKDIQLNSMRENIAPVALQIFPSAYSNLTLRVKSDNLPATIVHLQNQWKAFNSEWPFEYRFLDENFDRMYKAEERLAVLFKVFTGFTILVACLGLFGLVVYSTTQRYREVSIRKVLGATEKNLVLLLGKNFLLLILIAFIIAVPLSYYAAWNWLQTFAFRIAITPLLFVKASALITAIALLTVGVQSYKASRTNPVQALKEQ